MARRWSTTTTWSTRSTPPTSSRAAGSASSTRPSWSRSLADRDVRRRRRGSRRTPTTSGAARHADLETLFQLVNLYMTQPRFDPVALGQLQRCEQPIVDDPSSDPDTAGYDALLDARYSRRAAIRHPAARPSSSPRSTSTASSACGATATATPATGCSCSPATSTCDELIDLAGAYIATLPGTGTLEQWVDVERRRPPGSCAASRAGRHGGDSRRSRCCSRARSTGRRRAARHHRRRHRGADDPAHRRHPRAARRVVLAERVLLHHATIPTRDRDLRAGHRRRRIASSAVGDLVVASSRTWPPTARPTASSAAPTPRSTRRTSFVNNDSFVEELINDAIWPDRDRSTSTSTSTSRSIGSPPKRCGSTSPGTSRSIGTSP